MSRFIFRFDKERGRKNCLGFTRKETFLIRNWPGNMMARSRWFLNRDVTVQKFKVVETTHLGPCVALNLPETRSTWPSDAENSHSGEKKCRDFVFQFWRKTRSKKIVSDSRGNHALACLQIRFLVVTFPGIEFYIKKSSKIHSKIDFSPFSVWKSYGKSEKKYERRNYQLDPKNSFQDIRTK